MSKSKKKQSAAKPARPALSAKPSVRTASNAKQQSANPGSKQSRVIAMLQSPEGATIAAMTDATNWQPHSVRSFLAGVVRKRLKLKLASKMVDGDRIYQIASVGTGKAITARRSDNRAA